MFNQYKLTLKLVALLRNPEQFILNLESFTLKQDTPVTSVALIS
jgi:hypothetical protein